METESPTTSKSSTGQSAVMVQITTDGVPKLHCPVCNKALVSLNGYVKHVKKHEPPGGFQCRYCEARFCSEEELKSHRDSVHMTIACRICKSSNATFTNANDYREHIRIVHNGIDRIMYKCEKCGAEYKTHEPFKRHVETECGTIKPHKCDQCEMSFVTKYNLKQHKETHSGERKFCCSFCGKSFLQKGRLMEHERSHTGLKPYKCDVCGKCFAHRESIVTHSSIHTGIRLVECRCCSSRFSCYSNLIKHRRTRPETCGLPEYDPPKNRVRMRGSRIPATLNPTSEIKVSSLNKVIKPDDKVQSQKTSKKDTPKEKTKKVATKRNGRRKTRRRRKSLSETEEEQTNSTDDDDEEMETKLSELQRTEARNTNTTTVPFSEITDKVKSVWSDESLDSDNDKFDPIDSESDDDSDGNENKKPLSDSQNGLNSSSVDIKKENLDDLEFLSTPQEFEYSESRQFIDTDFNIKAENVVKFFSQKDKLLDSLLMNDDVSTELPPTVKVEDVLLEETEVLVLKDDTPTEEQEEDMLALKEFSGDDKLPTEDSPTKNEETSKRKRRYQKRNEAKIKSENSSKRMAKLTTAQLKERLKMLKREEKSWSCPSCIKIYHMRKPFERHLSEEHKFPEEKIREIVKTDDMDVINEEVFKCHICDKIYLMEKRLLTHIKLHGKDGKLTHKCPCYCNLFFATKEAATAHAHEAHRDTLYCEICKKFMNAHDGLKTHMRKHHNNEKSQNENSAQGQALKRNFVCDKCGKKFSGRTALTDHVRSDCGRKPLYPCHICGKHLTTAGILKTHLLLHKDETPYQCDICGKTFKVKAQYKTHIKTRHTDYKPFKCHLCPKEYPYRESLLTHMTVHTGIKRFLCNGCGKRFTCISNLQAHRKVHADTCGLLPLNPKATQYMGVQKGNLLLGSKPEAGLDYIETNTLIAKEVIDRDLPMAQEINFPSEPAAPLATVPLTCTHTPTELSMPTTVQTSHILLPQMMLNNQSFVLDTSNANVVYN